MSVSDAAETDARDFADTHRNEYLKLVLLRRTFPRSGFSRLARAEKGVTR